MDILQLLFKADTHELEGAEKTVEELHEKVADLAKDVPGLGEAFGKLGGIAKDVGKLLGEFELSLGGIVVGAAAAVAALGAVGIAMAFKWNEEIDEVNDLADAFGYSATQMLLMKEAAEKAGSSIQSVEGEYAKVAKAAFNANDPLKGTGAAFKQLGIDINGSNGELKSAQELTEEAVKKWKDGAQTTADFAAMSAVLGKSWEQNLPALEAVAEANRIANELQEKGIGISQESIKASDENKSANLELKGVFSDMGSRLVEMVIPAFTNLTKWLAKSYESGGLLKGIFDLLAGSTWALMGVVRILIGAFEGVDLVVSLLGKSIGALGASLVALVNRDWAGAKNVWVEYFHDAKNEVEEFGKSVKDLAKQQMDGLPEFMGGSGRTVAKNKAGNSGKEGGEAKEDPAKKEKVDTTQNAIEALINTLQKQVDVQNHLNTVQQIDNQLKEKQFDKASEANIQRVKTLAQLKDYADTNNIIDEGTKRLTESSKSYIKAIEDQIAPIQKSKEALALENAQLKLQAEYEKTVDDLKKKGLATESALKEAKDNLTASQQALNAEYDKQKNYMNDFVGRGVDSYVKGIGTIQDSLQKVVANGLQGFETQLDNLITTGKFNFKDFAKSILEDIAKMIIQFTIMIPIAKALKEALSGSGSSSSGSSWGSMAGTAISAWMGGAAEGGTFPNGSTVLVGEKGPELLKMGANGGTITPNSGSGMSSGPGSVTINTPIQITMTGGDVGNASDRAALIKQIQETSRAVTRQELTTAMRPGGVMNPVRR